MVIFSQKILGFFFSQFYQNAQVQFKAAQGELFSKKTFAHMCYYSGHKSKNGTSALDVGKSAIDQNKHIHWY